MNKNPIINQNGPLTSYHSLRAFLLVIGFVTLAFTGCNGQDLHHHSATYNYTTFANASLDFTLPGIFSIMARGKADNATGNFPRDTIRVCLETSTFPGVTGARFATDASLALGFWIAELSTILKTDLHPFYHFIEKERCAIEDTRDGELVISASHVLEKAGKGMTGAWNSTFTKYENQDWIISKINLTQPMVVQIDKDASWWHLGEELKQIAADKESTLRQRKPDKATAQDIVHFIETECLQPLHATRKKDDAQAWAAHAIALGHKGNKILKDNQVRQGRIIKGSPAGYFSILLHEIGHTAGLDHANLKVTGDINQSENPFTIFTDGNVNFQAVMATPATYNKTPLFITGDDRNGLMRIVAETKELNGVSQE